MGSSNEKKMFDLLLDEIEDTLSDIEQRCLKIDSSDQSKELQIIFRAAHNVKGAAQLYGLAEFGSFVHSFEDVLTALQKSQKPVSPQSVDILLKAQGFLRSWAQGLRDDNKYKPDTSALKLELKKHAEDLHQSAASPAEAVKAADPTPVAPPPPAQEPPPPAASALRQEPEPVLAPPAPIAPVAPVMAATPTPTPVPAPPVAPPIPTPPPAPISAPGAASQPAPPTASAPPEPPAKAEVTPASGKKRSSTLRISSDSLDAVMQLISELSIHQGILSHNLQNGTLNALTCKNAVNQNQKALRDLYDLVLTLRMQPAESLFQRMERTARDVAREQNKSVAIKLVGADTPLDKTVIELITDPMMHIVRNAIDHGIESDDERRAAGKPVPSTLRIQTSQDSNNVLLSISDNGRGMDPQLIYEKAIKKGLVPPGKKLSQKEIINLLFLPGFSTRDQVTHISGRGVGLDIVQKAIQELGGSIEIVSAKGKGSTFNIRLPASLEIIDGLVVRVTNQILIVPRRDVVEIVDLKGLPMEAAGHGMRAFRSRKNLVPVEDMADYLGLSADQRNMPRVFNSFKSKAFDLQREISLVIGLSDNTKLALRVDEILAQQQIVVRPISEKFAKLPGFSGMTILGNGEPAMIVSTPAIGELFLKWTNRRGPTTRDKDSA